MEKTFKIRGMHCNSCASFIERALKDRVNHIAVSYAQGEAEIDFDETRITEKEMNDIIKKEGYELISEEDRKAPKDMNREIIKWIFIIGGSIIALILICKYTGFNLSNFNLPDIQIPQLGERTSLILLFLAGLLTGFHCVSMCGGFVISYTAKNALNGYKGFKQHMVYGGSKVLSYAIIGGIFGLIGGVFAFSIRLRGAIAILAGVFMIFYALSMFGFRFFRRFQFNPKFLAKASSDISSKASGPFRAPFITGLLNGLFLACGPLQAMYLYAAGTGNFFTGALSLTVFGLGTLPVMLGFGSLATVISHKTTGRILKISAILVLILGLIMLNRGLSLTGSNFSFDAVKNTIASVGGVAGSSLVASNNVNLNNGIREVNMQVSASGYSPNSFVLKKGVPVKWNVDVNQLTGCNSELVVAEYDIDKKLSSGLNVIEFTPTKTGTITFTCGMGMLHGSFIVTDNGTATQAQITGAAIATTKSSGTCSMSSGGSCGCGGAN